MNMRWNIGRLVLVAFLGATSLSGCWGSSSNSTTLTLAAADTPVDGAERVVIAFKGVQIQGMTGALLEHAYSAPRQIDLLQLQDDNFALLLNSLDVPPGSYQGIRLLVDMSQSYIILSDGSMHSLVIPSGLDQTELPLASGFSIAPDEQAAFAVDFDLRKSITLNSGTYDFVPAMRLVDVNRSGALEGFVSTSFTIGGLAISDPTCQPAAYIYAGSGTTPVDINPTSAVQPLQTANVFLDIARGAYHYGSEYLPPGNYTVALVCAAGDDPRIVDSLNFSAPKSAAVTAAQHAEVDYP
ncbi:MAG TPA: DUF4382 domain-containing protein [Gammaproteobacteria bacterium]|nr:DUF4382 domain-containing protein [Gammaproteobacteria bacterium]